MLAHRITRDEKPDLIDRVLSWLDGHGYAKAYPAAREARSEALRLFWAWRESASDPQELLAALGSQVLDGQIDAADAAEALAKASTRDSNGVNEIAEAAIGAANARAWNGLSGPGIVTDCVRPFIESLASKAAEYRAKLPAGIDSDTDAIKSGAKGAAAWAALTDIASQLEDAWAMLEDVTSCGLVEHLEWMNDLSYVELCYRKPVLSVAARNATAGQVVHPVVSLIRDLDEDRLPTALTVTEALELRLSRDGLTTRRENNTLEALLPAAV